MKETHWILLTLALWVGYHSLEAWYANHPIRVEVTWGPVDTTSVTSDVSSVASVNRPRTYIAGPSLFTPSVHTGGPVKWCVWNQLKQECN